MTTYTPRVRARNSRSKIGPDDLARIRSAYESGAGVRAIATAEWERLGYANRHACETAIYHAFRRDGVPTSRQLRTRVTTS